MKETVFRLAQEKAPCYIYEYDVMAQRAATLRETFPLYDFLFSIKANPFPPVVRALAKLGIGADAASAQEVLLSEQCGMPCDTIYFSAAGKTDEVLKRAWQHGHLIADSLGEVQRIGALCRQKGERRDIGIRLNPSFGMGGGPGSASKFGIGEEDLPALKAMLCQLPVTVVGIHVHLKSQNLNADDLGCCYRDSWALAKRVKELLACPMQYVNFGSGVGIAYDETREQPMDLSLLRTYTDAIAHDNAQTLHARLLIESGRFLTGHMGTYWLRVVDKKVSRGTVYVIVENCMNGLQKPAIATMLRHVKPDGPLPAQEPMFTSEYAFPVISHGSGAGQEEVNIVGNLCCAQDTLVEHYTGAALQVGDLIEVRNAGAYACTLSAQRFSSHTPPQEYLIDADGHIMA